MAAWGTICTISDIDFLFCLIIFNRILPIIRVAHNSLQSGSNTLLDSGLFSRHNWTFN